VRAALATTGLPLFPDGAPFLFWEQYVNLQGYLFTAMGVAVVLVGALSYLVLWSWVGCLVLTAGLVVCLVETYGFMGIFGIKLSAIPAVSLVSSVRARRPAAAHSVEDVVCVCMCVCMCVCLCLRVHVFGEACMSCASCRATISWRS
jgi:hypothetical protein